MYLTVWLKYDELPLRENMRWAAISRFSQRPVVHEAEQGWAGQYLDGDPGEH